MTDTTEETIIDMSGPAVKTSAPKLSLLDQLKEVISSEVELPLIEIDVPMRDGVAVQYSPNIASNDLRQWRRKASNKKSGELDNVRFSCYVVVATAVNILLHNEVVEDPNGNPMTFNSELFANMVDVDMSQIIPDGVQAFFAVDAHLESTALAILDKAGYGDDIDAEDPTKVS